MHSFTRFGTTTLDGDGRPLQWGRTDEDFFPLRGPVAPLLRRGEEDSALRLAPIFRFRQFDLSNPNDVGAYTEVMTKVMTGVFTMYYELKAIGGNPMLHYIEWVENAMEYMPSPSTQLG